MNRDLLQEAKELLDKVGYYTLQDILDRIKAGTMQSWVNDGSWAVTQIVQYPRKKIVEVLMVVGDLQKVLAMEPRIEAFARAEGAVQMVAHGREGWDRRHAPGWNKFGHSFERTL